jgi:hypothetical protein
MPAKIALVGDIFYWVEKAGSVWTCGNTISAIDAEFRLYRDKPVFGLVGRTWNRTCRHTGGLIALHAIGRLKMERYASISLRLFYPIPAVVRGDAILKLT